MLSIQNLACAPRGEASIEDVSACVGVGEFVAIVGPNGSGKTTLCRVLALLATPSSGTAHVNGVAIRGAPWMVCEIGISVVLKGHRVFPRLTVREHFQAARCSRAVRDERMGVVFELFAPLRDRLGQVAGSLSGGEQQMLAIGTAILTDSSFLVIDEPALGLSPKVTADVYLALQALTRRGMGVLVMDESEERAKAYVDRTIHISHGRTQPTTHATAAGSN